MVDSSSGLRNARRVDNYLLGICSRTAAAAALSELVFGLGGRLGVQTAVVDTVVAVVGVHTHRRKRSGDRKVDAVPRLNKTSARAGRNKFIRQTLLLAGLLDLERAMHNNEPISSK